MPLWRTVQHYRRDGSHSPVAERGAAAGKESGSRTIAHPGGMTAGFWHSFGMRRAGRHFFRWCRFAQPPANGWEPCGFDVPRRPSPHPNPLPAGEGTGAARIAAAVGWVRP